MQKENKLDDFFVFVSHQGVYYSNTYNTSISKIIDVELYKPMGTTYVFQEALVQRAKQYFFDKFQSLLAQLGYNLKFDEIQYGFIVEHSIPEHYTRHYVV